MAEHLSHLPEYATAHLQLSLFALLLAAGISLPLGVWVSRRRGAESAVLGAASAIQTIPSLALLALMVPTFAALGVFTEPYLGFSLRSIGFGPALVALTLYGLLPILRNTVTGIAAVDPALVEAARGVGMTPSQRLWRVEVPLAAPVIVAGLRTATVWVVGMATLSTPVGATSLGNYIFTGLQTNDAAAVLVGCAASALLALGLDRAIGRLERATAVGDRPSQLRVGAALVLVAIYAGAAALAARFDASSAPIRIGAKSFSEQYVLAELLAAVVERGSPESTELLQSLGSTVVFDALRSGEVDLYVEYSGTVWATHMKRSGGTREEVLRGVREWLRREHRIETLAVLGFENAYGLAVSAKLADRLGLRRIGDLAPHAHRLEIGGDYQFFAREEWASIRERYGLEFRRERTMDPALMYEAAASEQVAAISAYTTDGRIDSFDLRLLEDDRAAIPPYDAIVLAAPGFSAQHPEAAAALAHLEGRISPARMRRSNHRVDEGGGTPAVAARELLEAISDP